MALGFGRRVLQIFAGMGSPVDQLNFTQNVAIGKGERLEGVAYLVPGRGQYNTEPEARGHALNGERIYRIDVYRVE